jgi:hypothetical protein
MCTEPNDMVKLLSEAGLIKAVYEDGLQPGLRQIGKALGTVLGFLNTILGPVQLWNEKGKIYFARSLDNYIKKMEEIPVEKIIEIMPDMGVPLLQKLSYVTDQTLSSLFTELLVSASVVDRAYSAHPSFVNVISNLSPDEAKLLVSISEQWYDTIPFIGIKYRTKEGYESFNDRLTGLETKCELLFPGNVQVYLENLVGLGILICDDVHRLIDTKYEPLMALYMDRIEKEHQTILTGGYYEGIIIGKGFYRTTQYGHLFFRSCIQKWNR